MQHVTCNKSYYNCNKTWSAARKWTGTTCTMVVNHWSAEARFALFISLKFSENLREIKSAKCASVAAYMHKPRKNRWRIRRHVWFALSSSCERIGNSAHCAKEKKKAMAKQAISYFRGDNVACRPSEISDPISYTVLDTGCKYRTN